MARVLIIDDDTKICLFLSQMVGKMGHEVSCAHGLAEGYDLALHNHFDIILLDLDLPDGNGLQILPDLLKVSSLPEVLIITGTGDVSGAELAFRYGAWDYIRKPFIFEEISLPITRALQYRREKNIGKISLKLNRLGIIGDSPSIHSCLEDVARASVTDAGVLLSGETGTGKELFARAIHVNSARSSGPFVVVDCGALPDTLTESILFGHEKGAFTGATQRQSGLMRQADRGTLFFDEIGELSLRAQKSLLRTLEERKLRPLGGKTEIPVDFKLLAATNRNLDVMVKEKSFRKDLLFRIRAVEIRLPPLRDRREDIQKIAVTKIHEFCQRYAVGAKGISPEFLEILNTHQWPGNVRELINVLEYALASARNDSILFPIHLPPEYRSARLDFGAREVGPVESREDTPPGSAEAFPSLLEYRENAEKEYLKILLERADGSREEACRLSGLSQSHIYGLLKKYDLARFSR